MYQALSDDIIHEKQNKTKKQRLHISLSASRSSRATFLDSSLRPQNSKQPLSACERKHCDPTRHCSYSSCGKEGRGSGSARATFWDFSIRFVLEFYRPADVGRDRPQAGRWAESRAAMECISESINPDTLCCCFWRF